MANGSSPSYHSYYDGGNAPADVGGIESDIRYRFDSHFHPYVAELIKRLTAGSLPALQGADTEYDQTVAPPRLALFEELFVPGSYTPREVVETPYPVKELDFDLGAPYAIYNWELFFHAPLAIAIHLSKNQRFEESRRWFHYIFDPTDNSDGPTPQRFWKVRPFQSSQVNLIEDILINLSTNADPQLREETIRAIEAWRAAPFRPHLIARSPGRQAAYMFKTVMAYLDNLIAWGDSLFRQDSVETINEATQLYVLAANILGPRPQETPPMGTVRPQTYASLRADLDAFGNALREVESDIPFDLAPHPGGMTEGGPQGTLSSVAQALYFCVPPNDGLLGYWDTVADRLFKIHNSLNIQGVFRQLPLFEPPIDPALLAKAAAAGLDVAAVVSGAYQPLPLVRSQLLLSRAAEICQEVKSLGNNLLSAMEKEDNEALTMLRARHERVVMEMVEHVKYAQLEEAIKSKEALFQSLRLAVQRYVYYERQLGKKAEDIEKAIPELDALDTGSLDRMNFAMQEPEMALRAIDVDIAQDLGESGGKIVSSHEALEMEKLAEARDLQDIVQYIRLGGQAISLLPQFGIKFHFWGLGGDANYGGLNLAKVADFSANAASALAERRGYEAGKAAKIGAYARREQDWAFQANLAAGEISQIMKQLRAAQLREAVADQELKAHRQQMKHAEEIERFLNEEGTDKTGKATNKSFYAWMRREVKGLYAQCFQFAFDIAKKAERAVQQELGDPNLSFIQFSYLAGKEGLLAGERLSLDIKRMEMAYHDLNRREYEMTKHVSLLQVDPVALLRLRTAGCCEVVLPEELFDMDGPGHYFRRVKSVAVSLPCVTGPYTSVNCTLTLQESHIRTSPALDGAYARQGSEDGRFSDYLGSAQAIVTSSGQSDGGLFETNLHDERYLPFEGSGVISRWQLELPANPSESDPCQFDYNTISDVVLHIRYTAREGGSLLRTGARDNLKSLIDQGEAAGCVRLFSIRHEFPAEWARFKSAQIGDTTPTADLFLRLGEEHYPFWSRGRVGAVQEAQLYVKVEAGAPTVYATADAAPPGYPLNESLGSLKGGSITDLLPGPTEPVHLYLDDNSMQEMWLALRWGQTE